MLLSGGDSGKDNGSHVPQIFPREAGQVGGSKDTRKEEGDLQTRWE